MDFIILVSAILIGNLIGYKITKKMLDNQSTM